MQGSQQGSEVMQDEAHGSQQGVLLQRNGFSLDSLLLTRALKQATLFLTW
jgi:hypothetical protein